MIKIYYVLWAGRVCLTECYLWKVTTNDYNLLRPVSRQSVFNRVLPLKGYYQGLKFITSCEQAECASQSVTSERFTPGITISYVLWAGRVCLTECEL